MIASRDLEIQRRGFINVSLYHEDEVKGTSADNPDLMWKMPKLSEGLPLFMSAIHLCYTKEAWESPLAMVKTSLSKSNQVRCRVHCGT